MQLVRIFAEVGTPPLEDRHLSSQKYRLADIARVARARGLPVNLTPRHFPTNPVPASAAIISAQAAGQATSAGSSTDSSAPSGPRSATSPTARWCATSCCNRASTRRSPNRASSPPRDAERNTDEALRRFVFGAPSYVVGEEVFWGQDRLPLLDAHLAGLAG